MNGRPQPWWVVLERALLRDPRQPWWVALLVALASAVVLLFRHELGVWTPWIYEAAGLAYLATRAVRPRAVRAYSGPYPLFDAAGIGALVVLVLATGDYYPTGVTIAVAAAAVGACLMLGEVCRRRERVASGT